MASEITRQYVVVADGELIAVCGEAGMPVAQAERKVSELLVRAPLDHGASLSDIAVHVWDTLWADFPEVKNMYKILWRRISGGAWLAGDRVPESAPEQLSPTWAAERIAAWT